MDDYYCRECAAKNGFPNIPSGFDPTGTPYQIEKFWKHTRPTGIYAVNSVYDDPSPAAYSGCLASGLAHGFWQVDGSGRTAMVWYAGKRVGQTNFKNSPPRPDSAIVIPHPYSPTSAHHYSTASDAILQGQCKMCGRPLFSGQE